MAQELLKSFEEFDEIENIQALAAERSAKTFENCKTKEEFEAIVGEAL